MSSFYHFAALCILAAWPVIPIFWIPAHLFHGFLRRRMGIWVYGVTAVLWLPCIYLVMEYGNSMLQYRVHMPGLISSAGWMAFGAGIILQAWTAWVMGPVIIGIPEVTDRMESRHVVSPPFKWCRHPTYLAHSMIFGGAALMTGYSVLFVLAALDFLITHFVIIPFEERELLTRLGAPYREYIDNTPRFFPSVAAILKRRRQ